MDMINSPSSLSFDYVVSACTCLSLRKATRVITHHFDEILKPSGLLITQFTVLAAVARAREGTINELAEILIMDRTTLTRNLKPLVREGWLQVKIGRDQRTRIVSLTTQGEAALERALPLWQKAQEEVVEVLGDQRWSGFLAQLAEVTRLMRQRI